MCKTHVRFKLETRLTGDLLLRDRVSRAIRFQWKETKFSVVPSSFFFPLTLLVGPVTTPSVSSG